jgi:hypothetical protein
MTGVGDSNEKHNMTRFVSLAACHLTDVRLPGKEVNPQSSSGQVHVMIVLLKPPNNKAV